MTVSCGIVGLPNVGKTTIFNALTAQAADQSNYPFSTTEPNVAMVEVPDSRLEVIRGFIETRRVVPAVVHVVDIAGLSPGASKGEGMGNRFLAAIRETDAIMQIVQCFENPQVVRETPVDPAGDIEMLELELSMADFETVSRAVERVGKKARTGDKQSVFEKEVFGRAHGLLEQGARLGAQEWKPEELAALKPLCLLTTKPVLYVANVGDDDVRGVGERASVVATHAASVGAKSLALCGDLECELRRLEGEDRDMFQAEYGIEELGLDRLIRSVYGLLGLQTFFTAGEKEIRAWTTHRGDKAPVAAGVIHSDFEKLFIRAEVYSVPDLVAHRSEAAIKAAGKMRTEGREYVMREGDVCHFLIGK